MKMAKSLRFPLRFKMLIGLLLVVTIVVGVITVSMAKLFHTDKTTYIYDLTSVIALNLAQETESLMQSYLERIQVFTRIIVNKDLSRKNQANLIRQLFIDFSDLVAITIITDKHDPVTVYDNKILKEAGLSSQQLKNYRRDNPLPMVSISEGKIFVENSTLAESMPMFTIAFAQMDEEGIIYTVSGVIQLNKLLNLTGRSQVFETFLMVDVGDVLLSHGNVDAVAKRKSMDWLPDIKPLLNAQSLGVSMAYKRQGIELVGGFASLKHFGLIAAAQIPTTAAYLTARELLYTLTGVAFALLIISAILGLMWSRRMTRPLEKLSLATQVVAEGNYDIHLPADSRDEIGDLATSFNTMAAGLSEREKELAQAQTALVQSEKMSAFGQLGAGIAHEIKNPLTGILGYAQLSMRKLDEDHPIVRNLKRIEKETKRCKEIIDNLMRFARQETLEYEATDVNEVVENAAQIVDHQLSVNQVKLEKNLAPDLPQIEGNSNQLQQTIMNFMINAQQAMDGEPGIVSASTYQQGDDKIVIEISDNGPGIPKDIQSKIFEPFFTTKEAGKGTGLGLSVTFGIIRDHHGEIQLESEPGEGATFRIVLPKLAYGDKPNQNPEQTTVRNANEQEKTSRQASGKTESASNDGLPSNSDISEAQEKDKNSSSLDNSNKEETTKKQIFRSR